MVLLLKILSKSFFLCLLFFWFAIEVNAQNTLNKNISKLEIPKNTRFIKIKGVSHEYRGYKRTEENIRLSNLPNNLIKYDSLDENNNLIYSVVCKPVVREHLITIVGDSISYIPADTVNLSKDSIIPQETFQYYIHLEKNGEYTSYFSNKIIHIKGYYLYDRKNGKWLIHNENGEVIKEEFWSNGILKIPN